METSRKHRITAQADRVFHVTEDQSILAGARESGISIPHTCGGEGRCKTCRFELMSGALTPQSEAELRHGDSLRGLRLACQASVRSDVAVEFAGPIQTMRPIRGNLTLSEGGPAIEVTPRENARLEDDRRLLLSANAISSKSQEDVNTYLHDLEVRDKAEIAKGTLTEAPGFGSEQYSDDEYAAARRRERLLYFNLEFTNKCNLACVGCFAGFGDVQNVFDTENLVPGFRHTKEVDGPLIFEELIDLIDQASALGAKTVDLIGGGEPLGSDMFLPLARHAVERGLEVEVFTNGTRITRDVAEEMAELRVVPFVKLYSTRSWVHDEMVGVDGAWKQAIRGIEALLEAGYGSESGPVLALESIVVRKNAQDLPTMWRYARENGMVPYFERFVGCHYDGDPGALLSTRELKSAWEELWLLDRGEYGYTWPQLPLRVGYTCATNFYSLYIDYEGKVRPCSGLFVPLANTRQTSLRKILAESSVVRDLREFEREEDSWCAGCYYYDNERCPGCRGMAEAAGGYMADDPLCYHNPRNFEEARDPRKTPHLGAAKQETDG